MVRRFAFAVPGDLATPTGGYAYDRRMIAELGRLGWQIDLLDLGEGFPWPDETTRTAARAQLLRDARRPRHRRRWAGARRSAGSGVAACRPQSADGAGASSARAGIGTVRGSKPTRYAQASARRSPPRSGVVVTSAATARLVASDYGVPAERITVARPGSDPAPLAQGSQDGVVRLLSVGAVVPRKGFDVLIAALATLTDLPWRLTIAGDRTRDREAAAQLDADIARHALGDRIAVLGAVSPQHLAALYAEADVFVLASRFEGYGMAYAEAIAHGLPVIGTNAGAIPETVPPDAGLLVDAGDVAALAQALRRVIGDTRSAASSGRCRARGGAAAPDLAAVRGDICARAGGAGMSGFSAEWLALREPYDLRARNPAVLDAVAAALKSHSSVRIVDLACGTGSTLRALGPHLPARQNWKLVDNDLGLLARADGHAAGRRCRRYRHPARSQP